jgi:hypothetical protein
VADDSAGPAAATLHTVALQTAALVRSIGLGYVLVQVVIWRDFFFAHPARLSGPLIAMLSATLMVITLYRAGYTVTGKSHGRGGARRGRVPAERAFGAERRAAAGGSPPGKQSVGSSPG